MKAKHDDMGVGRWVPVKKPRTAFEEDLCRFILNLVEQLSGGGEETRAAPPCTTPSTTLAAGMGRGTLATRRRRPPTACGRGIEVHNKTGWCVQAGPA